MSTRSKNQGAPLPAGPDGYVEASNAAEIILRARLADDAYDRFQITAGGGLLVGTGVSAPVGGTPLDLINAHKADPLAHTGTYERIISPLAYGAVLDGVADDTAAWLAAIAAATAKDRVVATGKTKISSTLIINKSIDFGGTGATRTSTDNSDPEAGLEFIYTATSGVAILVQPPNATNSRISPTLHNFLVRGNKNVGGATAGGGIKLDGRVLAGTAISGFVVEDVHVSDAKGDGFTVTGEVYEGRVVGLNSTDNAGKGVAVTGATGQPGEIAWDDIHTHDNGGDGANFDPTVPSVHTVGRWSSSRNTGAGFKATGGQFAVGQLHCESNLGSEVISFTDCVHVALLGVSVDYAEPTYVGTGLAIKGVTENVVVVSAEFSGSTTTWDITTAAGTKSTLLLGYRQSAANKVSFAGTNDLWLQGGTVLKGTFEIASDATNRVPARVRAFTAQTEDLFHWLVSGGGVGARVTAAGGFRSADDLVARLGAATQTQIGEMGPGGQAGVFIGADCSIYRRTADLLRTDDKFVAQAGLGVGNSAAATTPGSVVKKVEIFDETGVSLGFVPIYNAIT